ncbi:MAG: PIN domain-containing protein [Clostridiales bacterium]|nr:PIN domain-containing protein [Clostridiales bacterium]
MIKKVLRVIFSICGGLLGYALSVLIMLLVEKTALKDFIPPSESLEVWLAVICALLGTVGFFFLSPSLLRGGENAAKEIEDDLRKVSAPDFLSGTVGLIVGLILAFLISQLYGNLHPYLSLAFSALTYVFLGYLGVRISTKRTADLLKAIGENLRTSREGRGKKEALLAPKILDTSVIIDGRIADIMRTGFIEGKIVIPEFVLVELRHIADSSDALKRNRGRRGLDILNRIQNDYGIEIYNTDKEKALADIPEVDVKLLKLAQIMNGKVVTNDYNLNKVAAIKGVEVLNINELANTLKPVVLPGEQMQVFLVKEGKEHGQAVAYLDDGTMIVVDDSKKRIGETISIVVTSVLQTSAGRMIFGKPL